MFAVRKINDEPVILLQNLDFEEEPGYPTDVHAIFCKDVQDEAEIYIADWWDNTDIMADDLEFPEADNVTEIGRILVSDDLEGTVSIKQIIDQDKLANRKTPNRAEKCEINHMDDKALGDFIKRKMHSEIDTLRARIAKGSYETDVYENACAFYQMLLFCKVISDEIERDNLNREDLEALAKLGTHELFEGDGSILAPFLCDEWQPWEKEGARSVFDSVLSEIMAEADEEE